MSRTLAGFDRFIVLLLALIFAFFGVWGILYSLHNPYAKKLGSYRDSAAWEHAYQTELFIWVLIAVGVIALILGLWIFFANLRRPRITQLHSESASTALGDIRFNIADIASAVCEEIARTPRVNNVKRLVSVDRGRPTMEFTINAQADADIPTVRTAIGRAERDIRDSIADADIDTIYRIHLDQVQHS